MTATNLARKNVGHAIHGLRPHIKALELAEGVTKSTGQFRYEISADRRSARIVRNPQPGENIPAHEWLVVDGTDRSIEDWAKAGKQSRLAFIALKSTKEKLRLQNVHVQYSLNALNGQAFLTCDGAVMTEHPTTIRDWAPLGRAVEVRYFESYKAAIEWNNPAAAASVRATMETFGILRSERAESKN